MYVCPSNSNAVLSAGSHTALLLMDLLYQLFFSIPTQYMTWISYNCNIFTLICIVDFISYYFTSQVWAILSLVSNACCRISDTLYLHISFERRISIIYGGQVARRYIQLFVK